MNPTHLSSALCLQQNAIYLSLCALFGVRKDLKSASLRALSCCCCLILFSLMCVLGPPRLKGQVSCWGMFREVNVNVMQCKILPLVYTSRGFGPIYLNSVLSIVLDFRIKQEATIKVSAGFRGSLGSDRQGK